ncbi:MAG TPA: class I SAM-dependent methyltransferase [Steroidobacter sp.]|uniref:class I SAM-dependent methyltransferase n=1 Tax=Steroidobacter sp. TaxID=1978227 RepID=UPI002ED7748C
MRQVVYSSRARRLIYLEEKATPEFWDEHWRAEGKPKPISPRDDVITVTRRYLPPGARVLEGGCGRANKVKAMADAGFNAIGIDFAENSVKQAVIDYPDLDVRQGDVRALNFPDGYFDGYWSIGVIEHFWNGYDKILAEAARVLKPGGYLFLTAPWFSPYRRRKADRGRYQSIDFADEPASFYQFALGREEVCAGLRRHGFQVVRWRGRVAEISMKDDMSSFRRPIEWLLAPRPSIFKRALRLVVGRALDPYCGHSFLAVARRKG